MAKVFKPGRRNDFKKNCRNGDREFDNLDFYYEDCVIWGLGSFVVTIKDRDKFKEAILWTTSMSWSATSAYFTFVKFLSEFSKHFLSPILKEKPPESGLSILGRDCVRRGTPLWNLNSELYVLPMELPSCSSKIPMCFTLAVTVPEEAESTTSLYDGAAKIKSD